MLSQSSTGRAGLDMALVLIMLGEGDGRRGERTRSTPKGKEARSLVSLGPSRFVLNTMGTEEVKISVTVRGRTR